MAKVVEETIEYCENCKRQTKHFRNGDKKGFWEGFFNILLIVATCGIWLLIMMLSSVVSKNKFNIWICDNCGIPMKSKKTSKIWYVMFFVIIAFYIGEDHLKDSVFVVNEVSRTTKVEEKISSVKIESRDGAIPEWEYNVDTIKAFDYTELKTDFDKIYNEDKLSKGLSINKYKNQDKIEIKFKDLNLMNGNNDGYNFKNEKSKIYFDGIYLLDFKSSSEMFPEIDSKITPEIYSRVIEGMLASDEIKVETLKGNYVVYNVSDFIYKW